MLVGWANKCLIFDRQTTVAQTMYQPFRKIAIFILGAVVLSGCTKKKPSPPSINIKILPPEELYQNLFYDVQSNPPIFKDSKTFVDCVPKESPDKILSEYYKLGNAPDSVIRKFIDSHFEVPNDRTNYVSDSSSINEHITKLWSKLKRPPDSIRTGTLIPLPYPYIVPGGRFREIYYWDSYFTMLGLQADNQIETIQNMVDNFAHLINDYGFIPNGNRTYYLSRSQPPFFALMVSLLAETEGDSTYVKYQKEMQREYNFWMSGKEPLGPMDDELKNVVRLPGDEFLNRYWDSKETPRAESFREDERTAKEAISKSKGTTQETVYRNLRTAAESGWDFSSRWLSPDNNGNYPLYTIHTTDIIPVDLNALMYNMETTLSKSYTISNSPEKAKSYQAKANARKIALSKYCWNDKNGFFMDYNFKTAKQTTVFSLAGAYPLFVNMATKEQAQKIAQKIQASFLKSGGVVTSLNTTGQQWDSPNGWAPLQWITIQGLRNYGYSQLANTIKQRWLAVNKQVYDQTYKMMEKYNVADTTMESGGGEYPTQDGFGWTNGVYQKLSKEN